MFFGGGLHPGGARNFAYTANASAVTVKTSPGRLCKVLVTTTGTNAMLIYDNASAASGTVIGALPANPTVGSIYEFLMPANNGITIAGSASNPAVTISYD